MRSYRFATLSKTAPTRDAFLGFRHLAVAEIRLRDRFDVVAPAWPDDSLRSRRLTSMCRLRSVVALLVAMNRHRSAFMRDARWSGPLPLPSTHTLTYAVSVDGRGRGLVPPAKGTNRGRWRRAGQIRYHPDDARAARGRDRVPGVSRRPGRAAACPRRGAPPRPALSHTRRICPSAPRAAGCMGIRRRAKYILMALDDDTIILAHLGMSGRMCISDAATLSRRVPTTMSSSLPMTARRCCSTTSRRFGLLDLTSVQTLDQHPLLAPLGSRASRQRLQRAFAGGGAGRQTDADQGGAAGSADRRRARQYLRLRSAVPRRHLAAPPRPHCAGRQG